MAASEDHAMADRRIVRFLLAAFFVAGLTSTLFVIAPEARQQAATQQAYIVCYQFNGAPKTDYYSDPFPDTGNFSKFVNDFDNYVDATYHAGKHIPTCVYYKDQADAVAALRQKVSIAKTKVIETHWRSSDPAAPTPVQSPSMGAQPKGPDKSPSNPNAGAGNASAYAFCWEIDGDYTVYITPVLKLDKVNVQGDFGAFIQKTYAVNARPACPTMRDQAEVERSRQDQIDELKRATPKTRVLKFVDVAWTPPSTPATTAPAQTGVPSAPQVNPLDAYQKALEAQRPNGVAAPGSSAGARAAGATQAAATTAAKPATAPMFCYAIGSPSSSSASHQSHTYVTKVFAGAATAQPGAAFQTFLRNAHRDENISPGTCSTAPDADTLQGTREEYIATQRKTANRTVVEVDWKGGQ